MHTRFGQRLAVVDEHVAGLHNIMHALQTCSHSALGTKKTRLVAETAIAAELVRKQCRCVFGAELVA